MSTAYIPPGVNIQEITSTSLTPLLATPGSICLVGQAQGFLTKTDLIQLIGTIPTVLPGVPAGAKMASGAVQLVIDATNPSIAPNGYQAGGTYPQAYTFSNTNFTITRTVQSNLTAGSTASGQSTIVLAAGPVPAVGQVIRIGNTPITPTEAQETAVVTAVASQTLTVTGNGTSGHLLNSYSTGATVEWGTIPDGNFVYVTYQYTPADYFQPIRLNSMSDIQNRFGNAFDPTGSFINSYLSFAASLAFQNGASNVVLQPLFGLSGNQATTSDNANPVVWANVYTSNLLVLEDINIIVPIVGQSQTSVTDSIQLQIFEATQDLIYQMNTQESVYAIGIFGEDSTTSTVGSPLAQEATIINHAIGLQSRYNNLVSQQLVMVNGGSYNVPSQVGTLAVGGEFMAAAVAGMLAAQSPAATLTREVVAGFTTVNDYRTKAQQNNDAGTGLLVIIAQGNTVLVRHGITMDDSTVATQELNVVRAKHFMIESVTQTVNNQVIGKVVADANATTTVNNLIIATLEDLRGLGYIIDYNNVQSAITGLNPTTMAVTFDYLPAFVINYVNIQFTVDLTNASITVSSNGSPS